MLARGDMSSELRPVEGSQDAPNDEELVRKCQAGDLSAFSDLATRYKSKAFTMIYSMVQNEQDAWDLAQEVSSQLGARFASSRGNHRSTPGCTGS